MTEQEKVRKTMSVFEDYERRFAQAKVQRPLLRPWEHDEKELIIREVKDVLRFREALIPSIKVRDISELRGNGYTIRDYCYETWPGFYAASSLYMPDGLREDEKRPLILICPGHGAHGRRTESYQRMALRLVKQGAMALLIENIGQGDREPYGHWNCVVPFACGLTLQGMIVMETIAVIRWARALPHVDIYRIGACGNSGGGTLTCFLAALAPEISVIASSGYPSDFDYVMQKEKQHCCCNLFPHVCRRLEMWQVYGVFAPKPLLLEQGAHDHFFPVDLFYRSSRKVQEAYAMTGHQDAFSCAVSPVGHSWECEDRDIITAFLGRELGLPFVSSEEPDISELRNGTEPSVHFPENALSTDETAMRISGIQVKPDITLEEIFPPTYRGRRLFADEVTGKNLRNYTMRILSQMEMAL